MKPRALLLASALLAAAAAIAYLAMPTAPRSPKELEATTPGLAAVATPELSAPGAAPALPAFADADVAAVTPSTPAPAGEAKPPKSIWNTPLPHAMQVPPVMRVEPGALPYEQAMLDIMRAPAGDGAKAAALFEMLGQVKEEELSNTAGQAVRWLPDNNYGRVAFPIITNPRTHGQVLSALFADLMERPDAVALPTLVQIAKTEEHPFAQSAHDNLALVFGKDFGPNWPAWNEAVFQRLGARRP